MVAWVRSLFLPRTTVRPWVNYFISLASVSTSVKWEFVWFGLPWKWQTPMRSEMWTFPAGRRSSDSGSPTPPQHTHHCDGCERAQDPIGGRSRCLDGLLTAWDWLGETSGVSLRGGGTSSQLKGHPKHDSPLSADNWEALLPASTTVIANIY